jgi:hypothetical protein
MRGAFSIEERIGASAVAVGDDPEQRPPKPSRRCGRPIIGRFLDFAFRCIIRRVRVTIIGNPKPLDLLDRDLEDISLSCAGDDRPIHQVR